MRIPKTWMYIKFFSQRNRRTRSFHLLLLFPYIALESLLSRKSFKPTLKDFIRQFNSISLPLATIAKTTKLPQIEVLCVVAGKDLEILPIVISQAIKCSENEVTKVNVITRKSDLIACVETIAGLKLAMDWDVLDEELQISETVRDKMKVVFGARYGWVLQQFLAVNFVLNSKAEGILLVNADTILLQRITWLSDEKTQILMASTEYHAPYYELLSKLIGSPVNPRYTFITHHMLFQPDIFREILEHWGIGPLGNLVEQVVSNVNSENQSPMCVEFELYAQGIGLLHPELVEMRKFCNTTWKRSRTNVVRLNEIIENNRSKRWNSISLHDYA